MTGLVTFLATRPASPLGGFLSGSLPARERAAGFIRSYGAAFGIADPAHLRLIRESGPDVVRMEHVRYQQTHRGIPVTGAELTLHLRGANLVAVNAKTLADLDKVDVNPLLSADDAAAIVRNILEARKGISDAALSNPRLQIFNRGLLEGRAAPSRLAWFIEASKTDLRDYFWIDARIGTPLLQFSQLTDARNRQIYDANDPGDGAFGVLPGTLVRLEGGPPVGGAAATDANNAYDFAGDTYDYFFTEHGRDSYDNAGAALISTVRFCPDAANCPYANAFWNGTQMVYGAGFPAADDVVAHELTHAVTESSANLFYYMQSGALNESYSDIFGETIDLTNGAATDTPAVRWQLGEDVPVFGAGRDMMDPTVFGDPGKMSDTEFACIDDPADDLGGVHSNSGVPNHAFALMVDGGSYNGKTVSPLGLTKAGKIQYRALTHYLTSASDFLDNYNALKQSCVDLIGIVGITAADCTEVTDALDAVEMDNPWPCTPAQASAPAFCPAGQAPDIWHFQNMESLALAACPADAFSANWCLNTPDSVLGEFATSGENSIWGYNRGTVGFIQIVFNPGGTLPAGARMQFNHSYGFENSGTTYWDGGVIEYSTNNGANWSDGGPLISGGQAYGGTVSSCCSNPLAGRSAFVRESYGYTATQLDLSGLAGQTFSYRFYLGTDTIFDDIGWYVDDVRIFTCATCLPDRVLTNAHSGTAALYQANNTITAASGFTVGLAETVRFEAGSSIHLGPGFSVDGGRFEAAIAPTCP